MQRIHTIEPAKAAGRTKELFQTVEAKFGTIPNVAKVMANSPAVLDSFLALTTAMSGARIGGKLHHQIKLTTSEANTCEYCNSILTHLGQHGGISPEEILDGRNASSPDSRTDAALKFSRTVLETHGKIGADELQAVRRAGFDDGEIVEIITSVVVGCFTNFLNNVADTTLDIPQAAPLHACSTSTPCSCC